MLKLIAPPHRVRWPVSRIQWEEYKRSEFGWQVAVNLETDADLNEDGGGPGHAFLRLWSAPFQGHPRDIHCKCTVGPVQAPCRNNFGLATRVDTGRRSMSDGDPARFGGSQRQQFFAVVPRAARRRACRSAASWRFPASSAANSFHSLAGTATKLGYSDRLSAEIGPDGAPSSGSSSMVLASPPRGPVHGKRHRAEGGGRGGSSRRWSGGSSSQSMSYCPTMLNSPAAHRQRDDLRACRQAVRRSP